MAQNAKVIIDRSGDRIFRQTSGPTCGGDASRHPRCSVQNSRNDPLVQLADMWGNHRSLYRMDRREAAGGGLHAGKRLDNVWEFT
jgi:hypothetical protein